MKSTCSIEGCGRAATVRGYCGSHYGKWRVGQLAGSPASPYAKRCSVEGCDKPALARDHCRKHYERLRVHGDASVVLRPTTPLFERFWAKVQRGEAAGSCWEWAARRSPTGYGAIFTGTTMMQAHRVAWELEHGAIPDGLRVLHRCDNPPCVRAVCSTPGCSHSRNSTECQSHLYLGTMKDNVDDMCAKGRNRFTRKVPVEQIGVIALRAKNGESYPSIAKDFGVHPNYLGKLVRDARRSGIARRF